MLAGYSLSDQNQYFKFLPCDRFTGKRKSDLHINIWCTFNPVLVTTWWVLESLFRLLNGSQRLDNRKAFYTRLKSGCRCLLSTQVCKRFVAAVNHILESCQTSKMKLFEWITIGFLSLAMNMTIQSHNVPVGKFCQNQGTLSRAKSSLLSLQKAPS